MRRILLSLLVLVGVASVIVFGTGAANGPSKDPTYRIEMDNAFGLVVNADFKVDGVPAGVISGIQLDQRTLNALVTVRVTSAGVPAFHTSATCDSEPQSLIGEYFISCQPGTTGPRLADDATIPVSHTTSTIPADLVLDVLQVPERERLALIINSLGAGVAARSGDIASALDRALPALRNTDALLSLLAADRHTLQSLTVHADRVVSALADNSGQIQRFVTYANAAASDTATQKGNLEQTLARLPGFLTQLRPDVRQLGAASAANTPAVETFDHDAGQLDTLLAALPSFSRASLPAIQALGRASVTGRAAVTAAQPVVRQLDTLSVHVPELAQNLSIIAPDLNTQKNATEPNPRSPGGRGYSGLQALLQFAFNLANATNYYGPTGHLLGVDAFVSAMCTPYATPQTVADNLAMYGASYRSCYSFLGPNQPGVNETDPSDPSACVPDPGGEPTGVTVTVATSACKLAATPVPERRTTATKQVAVPQAGGRTHTGGPTISAPKAPIPAGSVTQTLGGVTRTLSNIYGTVAGVVHLLGGGVSHSAPTHSTTSTTSSTESLLNYLLSP